MNNFWKGFWQGLALGPLWRFLARAIYGEVVITTTPEGECVAVTRQDSKGQTISLIWVKGA